MIYIWKEHAYIMVELIFISFMLIYWLANMLYYIKMPHYHFTCNLSHWMASLIQRHRMFWWDVWGLGEQCGCCGRKLFYCSKLVLLNDDNDDTFGEYIKIPKQLKKIRRQEEMPKRRIPWKWQPWCFPPWYWWIFLWLIFLWLKSQQLFFHDSLI